MDIKEVVKRQAASGNEANTSHELVRFDGNPRQLAGAVCRELVKSEFDMSRLPPSGQLMPESRNPGAGGDVMILENCDIRNCVVAKNFTVAIRPPGPPKPEQIEEKIEELRRALLERNRRIYGDQKREPVLLDVLLETEIISEDFGLRNLSGGAGRVGDGSRRFTPNQILPGARERAKQLAVKSAHTEEARIQFVRRHGNIAGVVGVAGIGKSTLAKQYVKIILSLEEQHLVFFIRIRDLDFKRRINVFQFLTLYLANWHHDRLMDEAILEKISSSSSYKVHIVIDGLDEANVPDLSSFVPQMSLYDSETPDVILKNIMSGHLLPDASKVALSRPGAYTTLHEEYRPKSTFRVLGFGQDSQDAICLEESGESCAEVQQQLRSNPSVKAICYIPMFCLMVIAYVRENLEKGIGAVSISEVFASAASKCVSGVESGAEIIRSLSEVAFRGITRNRQVFTASELGEFQSRDLEAFLDVSRRIVDGNANLHFFSHLTWQEFFAAVHLVYSSDAEEFLQAQNSFKDHRWEVVARFVEGMFNRAVHHQMKSFFPGFSQIHYEKKQADMVDLAVTLMRQFAHEAVNDFPVTLERAYDLDKFRHLLTFPNVPSDSRLFRACALALESNNEGRKVQVARSVAASLPSKIMVIGVVQLNDVMGLCHVLSFSAKEVQLNLGVVTRTLTVVGEGNLAVLLERLAATKQKIAKLHLRDMIISTEEVILISDLLEDLEELELRKCALTPEHIRTITSRIAKRASPIQYFDLSEHQIDMECAEMLRGCLHNVRFLKLFQCDIGHEEIVPIAESIANRSSPIQWLNIGSNQQLGTRGARSLIQCIDKVEHLWLYNCMITGDVLAELAPAIAQRETPLKLLNAGDNQLGTSGAEALSLCVGKIENLWLYNARISSRDMEKLCAAIEPLETPIKILTIMNNHIKDQGAKALCKCLHNIRLVRLSGCRIGEVGKEALRSTLSRNPELQCRIEGLDNQ